jgi:hypothetical protein
MESGKLITIIPSVALLEMKLEHLAGRTATVIEVKHADNKSIRGCWVSLTGDPFRGDQEWYIPYSSISE